MTAHLIPPAEWTPHQALWTAWPSHAELWADNLGAAQAEVAAMTRALAAGGETVKLLVMGPDASSSAEAALGGKARLVPAKFGDIWLRDTGPIFQRGGHAAAFDFNGWGGKYELPHDDEVAAFIAMQEDADLAQSDFVLEGGAIDGDGQGNFLTTRDCLLNPNRNPGWSEADYEAALEKALGARHLIWIDRGLLNDHTDGHVDNIARFVGPATVMCQAPYSEDDPNTDVLDAIYDTLRSAKLADGTPLTVLRIPSPGLVTDKDGEIIPASHMNFIIGNKCVVLPIYGRADSENVQTAIRSLAEVFPGRQIVPSSSTAILSGGGSFHCITQQVPTAFYEDK